LLDRIDGPVMANRTLGILTRIMNWHATRSDTFRSPIVRGMARAEQAREAVIDQVWREHLARWNELEQEAAASCHIGPGDPDWPAA
jgi:hypothetical protein